ncbi:MAG: putative O-glycosylation ligase, exosortase A system-associated [Planctomycetes bacterium]|nr:putative O-glycosylation ligase, exosortase A system-associated [Planctomycetota bacterium]
MRGAIVLAIVLLSLPIALFRPYYGTLLWTWAAYFRPQDLAWGLQDMRLSLYIALATCIGFGVAMVLRHERFANIFTREFLLVLVMLAVLAIVCDQALISTKAAWAKFSDYWKIFLMTFLTASLITTKERLRMMAWAVALSLGALGFKGGLLGALRGARLQGPGGFLLDNNDFALALNMALPVLYYLMVSERRRLHRWMFGATAFFTAVAVVLTHSRGGFLGLAAVTLLIALKSRRRAQALGLLALLGVAALVLIPVIAPDYLERIETISSYDEDGSALGRFNAWATCWNIGLARPLTGVGPRNLDYEAVFARYSPDPDRRHVAHNIYFQTLSDGGFTLLVPFLLLLGFTYFTLRRLRKHTPKIPENAWFVCYCHMFEVSLFAYAVSGFFLSRNDFDLYYHIVGIVVAMKLIAPRVVVFPPPPDTAPQPLVDRARPGTRAPLAGRR